MPKLHEELDFTNYRCGDTRIHKYASFTKDGGVLLFDTVKLAGEEHTTELIVLSRDEIKQLWDFVK